MAKTKIKNFNGKIDWTTGLMAKLKEGLEKGMWFQRLGMRFFVPPENIKAYFNSSFGHISIYFHSDDPCTIATYSITSYRTRWALREEDLEDIYIKVDPPSKEAIERNEKLLADARKVFK